MRANRIICLALGLGLLTACQNLTPNQLAAVNELLGEYGFSLKTLDPNTGEAKTYGAQDVQDVKGEDGKSIPYSFDPQGRLVLKPTKAGPQTVKVILKDGSVRQFQFEGSQSKTRVNEDVAFVPDSSGQAFTAKVGASVDVKAEFQKQEDELTSKRVALKFGGANLDGLSAKTFKAAFFDRLQLPGQGSLIANDGTIMLDPHVFYLAQAYADGNDSQLPPLRIVYVKDDKLTVVLARMSRLPELPAFTMPKPGEPAPPPPPAKDFKDHQRLDVAVVTTTTADSFEAYLAANQLRTDLPKPGETPPPPRREEQEGLKNQLLARAVTVPLPGINGLDKAQIKRVFVGKHERPVDDVLEVVGGNTLKLDAMMVLDMWAYRVGPLGGVGMPFTHLVCASGDHVSVVHFRIRPVAVSKYLWLAGLATAWQPQPRPNDLPADMVWAPPPPSPDLLGEGSKTVEGADVESPPQQSLSGKTVEQYVRDLLAKADPNPDN